MNIGSLLPRHAAYRPEQPALMFEDTCLNWFELNAEVNRLANALLASGLKKGDKLATVLPNCLELMFAYWAAAKTGLVIVPCSPLLQSRGLISLLGSSDTQAVLFDASLADTFQEIANKLPAIEPARKICVGGNVTGHVGYSDFVSGSGAEEPPDARLAPSDDYNIMYSSGTTGEPKGIVHTHRVRAMYCTVFASAWRMTPESVVLHAGSIVFNGAMLDLMPWMYLGCRYILHPSFDAGRVLAEIKQERVTHVIMVPSQIIALLDHPDFNPADLTSLEMIQSVGAPLLLEHKNRLNETLPGRFYELYGLTEGFVTILDREDAVRKSGSVGCPPAFNEMRIVSEDGTECAPGEIGEICGRGPFLMKEYYKRPDLTRQAVKNGWLHSGDLGYADDDGYLFLVDRKKDMIISGGVNVYPKDIEEVVVQHPAVTEAAVFGIPHDKWGETPVAAVLVSRRDAVDARQLCDWVNARVGAKYQRLGDLFICDVFPRNVAGKTLKRELKETYLSDQTGRS